ncbi:hypothetical protein CRG98_021215 [Punica granatum]|uniref:Uncharacterized protein n=1 Tax=Punica granatum TaxID=22663 RepID=A0A2I0JQ26_PUNGR|nr:hypothetical protein CRG98_021215 [Punica granatum]
MSQDWFEMDLKIRADLKSELGRAVTGRDHVGVDWAELGRVDRTGYWAEGIRTDGGEPGRTGLLLKRAGPLENWAGPPDAVWAARLGYCLCWPGEEEPRVSAVRSSWEFLGRGRAVGLGREVELGVFSVLRECEPRVCG